MSHFSLLVRVSGALSEDEVEAAVGETLVPYQEPGSGCDHPRLKLFLEFEDQEDAYRKEYETQSVEWVRTPGGKILDPWDEAFRVKGSIGIGSDTYAVPAGCEVVQVPHRGRWASFEDFMKGWHGSETRDPEKGRYGHWRNPNAKWDWWTIGGRWPGRLSVRSGRVDVCRIRDLDLATADRERKESALKWHAEWGRFCAGEKCGDPFDGPRDLAFKIGALRCVDEGEMTGSEWKVLPWPTISHDGRQRYDVLSEVRREDVLQSPLLDVFDPIRTWARLCPEEGWVEPGEMGWWGITRGDTPASYLEHAARFRPWLASGDPADWVVTVDCHI